MKVGGAPWKEDLKRVETVRAAIGSDALLMVDANRAYNAAAAIAFGRHLADHDVFWFEEPVPPEDIEGYRAVKTALPLFIAGGECEFTQYGFRRLFDAQAVDIVQPEICIAGGISECRKIADQAYTAGVFYVPHMHGSALALAASLQLVASLAPVSSEFGITPPLIELDAMRNPLREDLLVTPLAATNGQLTVPAAPGLGVEVNMETVLRYQVTQH
jgi:D-galactarolactone cycloisomerase